MWVYKRRARQNQIKSKQNKNVTKDIILLLQISHTVLADLPELKKAGQ